MREVINPKSVHWPIGYSHIAKIGDTLHISGQLALDQEGNIVGKGDMVVQTEKAYENLKNRGDSKMIIYAEVHLVGSGWVGINK